MAAKSATKVGALLLAAIGVLAVGVLLIGEKNNLFSRKQHYYVEFSSVSGLKAGNPVQLDGVDVGAIESIVLPEKPSSHDIRVEISIDQRYAERVRAPQGGVEPSVEPGQTAPVMSVARIKTLGLLGDKFIEINSGAEAYPAVPSDGRIPAAGPTNVDALLASGENVMDNVVTISSSLSKILTRMERGEGLLGELTSNSESGRQIRESLVRTSQSVERIATTVEDGKGIVPRLLNDQELAGRLDRSLARLEGVLAKADTGDGLLPGLLNDPSAKVRFDETLANLQEVSADVKRIVGELEGKNATLPRLLFDEEYGEKVTGDLANTVARLSAVADKLDHGEGSAAKIVNDPRIYEAINDIIIGVNDSRMLRWLIRNRQKAGIKKRYTDAQGAQGAQKEAPQSTAPSTEAPPEDRPEDPPLTTAPPA